MKKLEKILGIIILFAIIYKFLHLPGASLLLIVSVLPLATIYYFGFAFFNDIRLHDILKKTSYENLSTKRIFGCGIFGVLLSSVVIGILFKLQFYPGASLQLSIGLKGIGIVLIVATIYYFKHKSKTYKKIISRILIIGTIGICVYIIPSSKLVDIYYRNDPAYAELFKKVLANPNNEELQKELQEMRNK